MNLHRTVPLFALVVLLLALVPVATPASPDAADKVEALVLEQINAAGRTDFFVWLAEKADLSAAEHMQTKLEKGRFVYETLVATAERTQKDLRAILDGQGVRYQAFYIANKVLVYGGDEALLWQLAGRPDVVHISANHQFQLEEPIITPNPPPHVEAVEPNIAFVKADQVWAMGYTGQGTVLAGQDVGLDVTHPAIARHYRGCVDPPACTLWDHNYNWWDASRTYPIFPGDGHMHGTYTTGIMVGDDGGANQIGVAPGAQTIHCKHCTDEGVSYDVWIMECFQWELAPWDLNRQNPRPDLAPDAVNNSWGYGGYYPEFEDEVAALQAAGILVEASVGNSGPACNTVLSPGAYEPVLTTGSVNHAAPYPGTLTGFSSRGPSVGYPADYFPDVMAPGQNVRSSTPGGGYVYESGTSASGPHVTGLVGLLWSACPLLRGQVALTQEIIKYTAVPLTGQGGSNCGGDYVEGPNNDWGFGTIDALAAVQEALARCGAFAHLDGHVYDLGTGLPIAAARVVAERDLGGLWALETDAGGYYTLTTPAGAFTVTASAFGYYSGTIGGVAVITGALTTQNLSLTALPAYLISGTVAEAGTGAPLSATVGVVGSPYPPALTNPATGFYALLVPSGTHTLRVESWGSYWQERTIIAAHDQTQDFALTPMPFVPYRGNPVLEAGPPPAWDRIVFAPDVLQYGGLTYLFYTGGTPPRMVGYAVATDGLSFTKSISNPILIGDGSGFDAYEASVPTVLVEDGVWILYYSGSPQYNAGEIGLQVGRATGPGPAGPWTRSDTPVLQTGNPGEWDEGSIVVGNIIPIPGGYVMYYYGWDQSAALRIGMAVSSNGLQWTKYDDPATTWPPYAESDPVMMPGPAVWDARAVGSPWGRQTAAGWEMLYTGCPWGGACAMGYATSADGIHWFKYAGNPVLDPQYGPWAVNRIAFPTGFISGTTTVVYYDDGSSEGGVDRAVGGVCMPLAQAIFSWQPVTPTVGDAITLTAAAAGTDPVTFAWDLGDGFTGTGRVISHTYAAPGTYTVTLTATNCETGTATVTHTVTVVPPCVPVNGANFSWQPMTPPVDEAVTFTGTVAAGDEPITYVWKLAVGSWNEGQIVTHSYALPSLYTVWLTATNCATATALVSHTLNVVCPEVADAGFTWTPDAPEEADPVTFTATASSPRPVSYAWDLGDGASAVGVTVTHAYTPVGDYLVTLTATNDCGAWQAVTDTLAVTSTQCQEVRIVSVTMGIAGCEVAFGAALSGDPPFAYLWDLGPFGAYSDANPVVDFQTTGIYTGTLRVWNCGNPGPASLAFSVAVACGGPYLIYLPLVVREGP